MLSIVSVSRLKFVSSHHHHHYLTNVLISQCSPYYSSNSVSLAVSSETSIHFHRSILSLRSFWIEFQRQIKPLVFYVTGPIAVSSSDKLSCAKSLPGRLRSKKNLEIAYLSITFKPQRHLNSLSKIGGPSQSYPRHV